MRFFLIKNQIALMLLFVISCAAGPTPERVGFNYPEFGIKFSPRRYVVCRAMGTEIKPLNPDAFNLLFPRITAQVENEFRRLLFSAVAGEWTNNNIPLFDEINRTYYGIKETYSFDLVEEKSVEVPWQGLENKMNTLRIFYMAPLPGKDGSEQYTFTITLYHYGNTFEICWRDASNVFPDQQKIDDFFYWTKGLKFFEPKTPGS